MLGTVFAFKDDLTVSIIDCSQSRQKGRCLNLHQIQAGKQLAVR